jgi:hypothetical protein
MTTRRRPLIVLETLTAVSALYGGIGLMSDNAIHMPDSWLQSSPFSSWTLPGLFLLGVVAVPMGVAAVLEVLRSRRAAGASLIAGGLLVGWICVEFVMIGKFSFLQPVMVVIGAAVAALAVAQRNESGSAAAPGQQMVRARAGK